jgi:DNA polymerase III alpha subunit (gram-positive type)
MHYLFFDCETAGLDKEKNPLLTAYFGVYDKDLKLIDELDLQVKPDNIDDWEIEADALKITGINLQEHLDDPQTVSYKEGEAQLIKLLDRNKIPRKRKHFRPSGQNIQFDLDFIFEQLIDKKKWLKYVHHNTIDTLRILTFLQDCDIVPNDLGSLSSMVEYFNVPMGQAHNAKEDTRMTVDVYKALKTLINSKKADMSGNSSSLLEIVER